MCGREGLELKCTRGFRALAWCWSIWEVLGTLLTSWRAVLSLVLLGSLTALGAVYLTTRPIVLLDINGVGIAYRTHKKVPGEILREAGVILRPEDELSAPDGASILRGAPIRVTLARQIVLIHGGGVTRVYTSARNVAEAIADAGVVISEDDRIYLMGEPSALDARLPLLASSEHRTAKSLAERLRHPVRLAVQRAVPFTVQEGTISMSLHTVARTVGQALFEHGVIVYAGDRVFPGLTTGITPGLHVYLDRSHSVTLDLGGTLKFLRTRQGTVRGLLAEEGVVLGESDYVIPSLRAALDRDTSVAIVRVYDEYYVEETPIAVEERWEPEPDMEIDQRSIVHWGQEGAQRRRIRVHYENGREISRSEETAWVAREPVDRVFRYGTKIVLRELETSGGILTYWRKLRMLATSYNAPTAGKAPDHPTWGIKRLGLRARKGIIAVDPRVINMRQEMYVPDYGPGVAADTGSAIIWRRVDLCFDDDNLELWRRWVDVYLLAPVPPEQDINWVVPNWPNEKE